MRSLPGHASAVETASGETAATWALSSSFARLVAYIGFRYRLSPADTEDMRQETCYALLRQPPDRQLNATFVSQVARRKAIDIVRSNLRSASFPSGPQAVDRDPALTLLLRSAVARLPKDVGRFWSLRVRGYTQVEIAEQLGLSRKRVRSLGQECLRRL